MMLNKKGKSRIIIDTPKMAINDIKKTPRSSPYINHVVLLKPRETPRDKANVIHNPGNKDKNKKTGMNARRVDVETI